MYNMARTLTEISLRSITESELKRLAIYLKKRDSVDGP